MPFLLLIPQILAFITVFVVISAIYKKAYNQQTDPINIFNLTGLQMHNNFHGMLWPEDESFLSLKFSALRHCIGGIVAVIVIYYARIKWLSIALIIVTFLHWLLSSIRYDRRKADYKYSNKDIQQFLKPVKNACFAVQIQNFVVWMLALTSYFYIFH